MSLRPEISGFSLARLRSLLGSRDRRAMQTILEGSDDPEQIKDILERAVLKGAPFAGLDAEDETHAAAVIALASYDQDPLPTGSNIWKAEAFDELWDSIEADLASKAKSLYQYLQTGRPLLGKRVESSWTYYAWLTRDELALLLRSLKTLQQKRNDPTGDGFLGELIGWLEEIDRAGRDLWFYAV